MTRISTNGAWDSALLNLMNAQQAQETAQIQVSTGKIATDLGGFGQGAQTLTAFVAAKARTQGYIDAAQTVSNRLSVQDTAFGEISDAGQSARQAITNAIATGSGTTLMTALQQNFQQAVDGLNTQSGGEYVFGGGRTGQPPTTATTMSGLPGAPSVASLFQNGQLKSAVRLDDSTTVETGFLASDVGGPLFQVFQSIQAYANANGPFGATLTSAQQTFLTQQMAAFDQANGQITQYAAQNGEITQRVQSHITAQQAQVQSLTQLIGKQTDVDMATALSKLSQSQQAVQASAQILAGLKSDTLLNILTP